MDELLMAPPMTASTIRGLLPRFAFDYDLINFFLTSDASRGAAFYRLLFSRNDFLSLFKTI